MQEDTLERANNIKKAIKRLKFFLKCLDKNTVWDISLFNQFIGHWPLPIKATTEIQEILDQNIKELEDTFKEL
jgi:hypothetical protein